MNINIFQLPRRVCCAAFLAVLAMLHGCVSIPSVQDRTKNAQQLAAQQGWEAHIIKTPSFNLMSYQPPMHQIEQLTIYIEGDGLAWITSRQVSSNPTPSNPLALKLALSDSTSTSVYLARPCQFVTDKYRHGCENKYWTNARFSPEVISAMNQAVSQLKEKFQASRLVLVGYSGGGAVAALLASMRDDVVKLITIAGNLDHQEWTDFHHISPLKGSLNAADYRQQLSAIEQIHFVGEKDKVIPPFLAQRFIGGLSVSAKAKVVVVPEQTHGCCWDSLWPDVLLGLQK
ncbi:alpha/beta hydrolase family protein [Neptunomonas antarctica]|uniref:alpha/beta hydrolase family protein n=1 Tax=Neptunomonas antarctica TaxID=619304 RepID=UPI00192E6E53|nr:alpha/beta hydrolase [Neptunomonas antarctica]